MKRWSSPALWVGVGLTVAAFLLYAVTLTPGVPPTDSGELILAAWLPGNAHAPGFPLWVILGWLWSHLLPLGRIAWRLNLLSAFCGALAVGLTYALALRTLGRTDAHAGRRGATAHENSSGGSHAAAKSGMGARPAGAAIFRTASESSAARVEASAGDRLKARLPQRSSALAAAAVGAAALGLGRTVWSWATVAEVYTLSLALAAAVLLLVVSPATGHRSQVATRKPPVTGRTSQVTRRRSRAAGHTAQVAGRTSHATRSTQHAIPNPQSPPAWPLIAAAFLFGLGLGGHLTSVALLAPVIALWLTVRRGPRVWWSKTALCAALALAAGAAVYLYLPLRAAADPLLNWGDPDTWQRFWWHVTAKQYRVSLFSSPVGPQVLLAAKLWWTQFTPVGLGLLLLGAWQMARRQRALFWALALIVAFTTFYAWAYVIEDDQDAYYLPAFLAGAVWVAWGAEMALGVVWARLAEWGNGGMGESGNGRMREWENGGIGESETRLPLSHSPALPFSHSHSPTLRITDLFAVLLIAPALAMNWGVCDRHADTIPEDYVRDTFAELAPAGLLLTRDWQLVAPALYLQHVEGLRPDLTVVDTELLRRRWYFDYLHKVDPDLMTSVAAEEQAFLALRDPWERGEVPDGDPRIGQLQAAYIALLDAFIQKADAAGRPVHAGPNRGAAAFRAATLAGQPDMEPGVGAGRGWLPVGLSFRAVSPSASPPLWPPLAWHVEAFRQVVPSTPERKIQATRADMAALRGLLQANAGNLDGAEADWRTALAVDSAHGPAIEYLRRLDAERNK